MRRFAARSRTRSLVLVVLATLELASGFLLLAGCGQTGPLTLEEPPAEDDTDTESDADEDER